MAKIGIIHYLWNESSSGVNTVINNNIEGLLEIHPNLEPVFISDRDSEKTFPKYEKRNVKMNGEFANDLLDKTRDLDAVIIENPFRNLEEFPIAPQEYKRFVENFHGQVVYRHHDVDSNLKNIVPRSKNIKHTTLVEPTKNQLENEYGINVDILKNSVICENFYKNNPKKDEELRKRLEKLGMVLPNEKIIAVPNRIVDRKNIEESLMITKLLNESTKDKYRLLVTTSIKKNEPNNFFQIQYQKNLEALAKKHNIPSTLGEISEIIDGENLNIGNLYHIADLALSTSVKEGFGYMFVEPWISDTALIGRHIEHVIPDFHKNGLDLRHLYDDDILVDGPKYKKRIKNLDQILSDKKLMYQTIDKLQINERRNYAKNILEQNKKAVEKNYNHVKIADELANYLKLNKQKRAA
jgi:glycosyltransferase involved in cell wall biosynthesis